MAAVGSSEPVGKPGHDTTKPFPELYPLCGAPSGVVCPADISHCLEPSDHSVVLLNAEVADDGGNPGEALFCGVTEVRAKVQAAELKVRTSAGVAPPVLSVEAATGHSGLS
jgi:hypothetical protein